jgi:hypothetical protein
MFKWIGLKFFGSELKHDLDGLRSLPLLERLKTAGLIVHRIQNGMDIMEQGATLAQVQAEYQQIRREAVAQATGYSDPVHLVGSLPETFFITLSESYPHKDGLLVRQSISTALGIIFQNDSPVLVDGKDLDELIEIFKTFQCRLVDHKFI